MYPFSGDNTYIRNSWYVACLASEIDEKPLARTIMDQPVAIYRTQGGAPAAMHGICPHRYFPLALNGRVTGDSLQCNYHGYAFDGKTGACTLIPSAPDQRVNYEQRVYPVVERGPWIWIWPGDPRAADESLLPTIEDMRMGPGYAVSPMMDPVAVKGRYMLGIENLLDLTHISFLHAQSAQNDQMVNAEIRIEETDTSFRVLRYMRKEWYLYHESLFGPENRFDGKALHESDTHVLTPGYVMLTAQTVREIEGVGEPDPEIFGELWFHHAITPETPHSCHYFGTQSRTIRRDDPDMGGILKQIDTAVRAEDIQAMEEIERHLVQFGEPVVELMTRSDAPAGRLRRRFQRMLDQEAAEAREMPA